MMDTNRHKFFMLQLLKEIFSDALLSSVLAFKGGTALMFFHNLPRFSTDLDFNLLDKEKEQAVYARLRQIVLKYGTIHDEAVKFYGIIIVLDYGVGERKLKIEVSNREYGDHYEIKNYLGLPMRVMTVEDMFSHKLCALLDRTEITGRDVFDCWFFLKERVSLNKDIVEKRMGMPLPEYLDKCIDALGQLPDKNGEGVKDELISLLNFYKVYPL